MDDDQTIRITFPPLPEGADGWVVGYGSVITPDNLPKGVDVEGDWPDIIGDD
jgi:hypothetical protein